MEKPIKIESLESPKSPEFEFWMVRNPSTPQPHILTADQLFSHGLILPLHTIDPVPSPTFEPAVNDAQLELSAGPQLTAASAISEPATGSRRWKDIFKKSESTKSNPTKETTTMSTEQKVELPKTDRKRDRKKNSGGGQMSAAAELNIINIWPFSRSRSAKTSSTRSKVTTGGRKVSSAPCSRSNSGSELKSGKLPGSPTRGGGIIVGRSSPVWQARRGGAAGISRLSAVGGESSNLRGGKGKNEKGCKEATAASDGGDIGGGRMRSGVVNRFNFRTLFTTTRKVY